MECVLTNSRDMQRNYQGERERLWRKHHLLETNILHVAYGPLLFNIHA